MRNDSDTQPKTGYTNWKGFDRRFMRCIRLSHKQQSQSQRKKTESHLATRKAVINTVKDFILTYFPSRPRPPRPMGHPKFHHNDLSIAEEPPCPIDSLPDDMLYEVFVQVIADADAEPHNQHAMINDPNIIPIQVMLASICSRWRTTITSMPRLWSKIILDCESLKRTGILPRDRLGLYLRSSGRLPITLSLIPSDRSSLYLSPSLERLYGELLDLLGMYCCRWKDITLMMDHRLASKFQNINPTYATMFSSLAVDFRTQYFFDEDPYQIPAQLLSFLVQRSPYLTTLDWRICSPWSYIPAPPEYSFWEKLTSVSITVSYGLPHLVALTILRHLKSALSIGLNAYVHRVRADGLTREVLSASNGLRAALPDLIRLPELRTLNLVLDHELEVVHDRVLGMIAAPGLERLALSLDSATEEDAARLLVETKRLVANAPNLEKMHLRVWRSRSFPGADVAHLIMMCLAKKTVTEFVLVAEAHDLLSVIWRWMQGHTEAERLRELVRLEPLQNMSKFDVFDVYTQ